MGKRDAADAAVVPSIALPISQLPNAKRNVHHGDVKTGVVLLTALTFCSCAASVSSGGVESVAVVKIIDSEYKAIIQRRNGETYLIEYGIGALSMWRYEGKSVLISSPGLFGGVGSSIILPDDGQKARIWNAEPVDRGSTTAIMPSVQHSLTLRSYSDPAQEQNTQRPNYRKYTKQRPVFTPLMPKRMKDAWGKMATMTGMIEFYCRPNDRRDKAVQKLLREHNVRVLKWGQIAVSKDVIRVGMTVGR